MFKIIDFINVVLVVKDMIARENWIGAWAYTVGLVLAIVIGVVVGLGLNFPSFSEISIYLSGFIVVLGIIIGSVNVNYKETNTFLLAGAILVIVSKFGVDAVQQQLHAQVSVIGSVGVSIFNSLLLLFVPATIIVAIKALFSMSKV